MANKKYNIYDLSGEYGIGYTSNTNEQFFFDLDDYEQIKDYCWYVSINGYITTRLYNERKQIRLHRLLMNFPDKMVVDHINHNKLDNRKCNLRICFQKENASNKSKSKNNTSGVTGVCWHKKAKKWHSQIKHNRKNIHLGLFDNFDDAVKARREAEEKYFGEFSYASK